MQNLLKVSLAKNMHYKYSNIYNAQIIDNQNITITDIIDELSNEGLEVDQKLALSIINRFNQKVSEKVFSGKNVCTGLVNINPIIKGTLNEKIWNPKVNRVEIAIIAGCDLNQTMSETTVEIIDEKQTVIETYRLSDQAGRLPESNIGSQHKVDFGDLKLNVTEDPACGIAFRTWLWKS